MAPQPCRGSKLLVCVALASALLHNCRSPHHLNADEGDVSGEPELPLPGGVRRKAVGAWHLTWGLGTAAASLVVLTSWYATGADSPARLPWSVREAAAAVAAAGGAVLRTWCFAELGRLFTYEVGIRQGHTLVQTGPYALLLHPSYLGIALLVSGFLWYTGGPGGRMRRPAAMALFSACGSAVLAFRIYYEEQVLSVHFGEAWRQHALTRWRLVPFVL